MAGRNVEIVILAKDRASAVFGKVSVAGSRLGSALSGIGAAAASLPALLASVGAAAAGRHMLTLAMDAEQAAVSFEVMLGSAERAKRLMSELHDFAASTPFELPELVGAGKSLLAFGFAAEDLIPQLRRIGDLSSALNIPIGELADLYGKARVQGRLFAQDVNQLTGRGIPVIQQFAKQFGVADSEVRKLVESGKVGFPQLEKAFAALTSEGGQFAGMMEKQSKTMAGLASTAKDDLNAALRETGAILGKELIPLLAEAAKQIKGLSEGMVTGAKVATDADTARKERNRERSDVRTTQTRLRELIAENREAESALVKEGLALRKSLSERHPLNIVGRLGDSDRLQDVAKSLLLLGQERRAIQKQIEETPPSPISALLGGRPRTGIPQAAFGLPGDIADNATIRNIGKVMGDAIATGMKARPLDALNRAAGRQALQNLLGGAPDQEAILNRMRLRRDERFRFPLFADPEAGLRNRFGDNRLGRDRPSLQAIESRTLTGHQTQQSPEARILNAFQKQSQELMKEHIKTNQQQVKELQKLQQLIRQGQTIVEFVEGTA